MMRRLGKTNLQVSEIGFGTYRIHEAVQEHHLALELALNSGINLIDTSINYTHGGSERLIGQLLQNVDRQKIILVTKGGCLQGDLYQAYQEGAFQEGMILDKNMAYCIHPDCLEWQLSTSLDRLMQDYVDIYLIQNPEYYLISAEKKGLSVYDAEKKCLDGLEKAFSYLEQQVEKGRIHWYGISSNTLSLPSDQFRYLSLEKIMAIAGPHFAVLQFPLNLLERSALLEENSSQNQTLMTLCQQYDLGVLINRPLNALQKDTVIRLTDIGVVLDQVEEHDVRQLLEQFAEFEKQIWASGISALGLSIQEETKLQELLAFTQELQETWMNFSGYIHWREVLQSYILPKLEDVMDIVSSSSQFDEQGWFVSYMTLLKNVLTSISSYYQFISLSHHRSLKIKVQNQVSSWHTPTLQHTAIRALRETKGISSILVGMRKLTYVKEFLAELEWPIVPKENITDWQALDQVLPK